MLGFNGVNNGLEVGWLEFDEYNKEMYMSLFVCTLMNLFSGNSSTILGSF